MSTVLLMHPQAALGERLQTLIQTVSDFRVVGQVLAADELRGAARALDPDLVVADLDALGGNLATTLRQLREGRYGRPKLMVLARAIDDPRLIQALRDGADGWFAPGALRSLPNCMAQVLRGESMMSPSIARAVQEHFDSRAWDDTDFIAESQNPLRLSGTERLILQWTIDGQTPAELARALQIRVEVVGVRLRTILRKLQFDLAADSLSLQG